MTLLVVIVNYRSAGLTIDCLRSLESEVGTSGEVRVVVTDNASNDGSVPRIESAIAENGWGDWVALRPLDHNGGFAAGNNAAIRPALKLDDPPRYVLLLNPDTIVRPGALTALVEFMDRRPDVGIAGSRMEDPDGTPQFSAFPFHSILGEIESAIRLRVVSRLVGRWIGTGVEVPDAARPTDWVAGASMIIRREVFETVGLLDEAYFMYFEEMDFCLRARRAGWPCWYVPESHVVHLVGQSSGVTDPRESRKRRPSYWFRSRRRYFLSHHGVLKTVLADVAWSSAYVAYRARRAVLRKPNSDPRLLLWDFIRHNFFLVKE